MVGVDGQQHAHPVMGQLRDESGRVGVGQCPRQLVERLLGPIRLPVRCHEHHQEAPADGGHTERG